MRIRPIQRDIRKGFAPTMMGRGAHNKKPTQPGGLNKEQGGANTQHPKKNGVNIKKELSIPPYGERGDSHKRHKGRGT